MEPNIQYCRTSDGVRIAVSIIGDGPPLVLIPNSPFGGLQPGSVLYPEALRSLAASFRLVEYDPRGCGFSERAIREFSLDCMVRDVEAVLAHAGLEASAFCALADGVPVAIAYAAAWPEHVSHLILVDGWYQASDLLRNPSWRLQTAIREQDWTLYTETTAGLLLGFGFQGDASVQRLAEYMRSSIDQDAMGAMNAAFDGWDLSGLLSRVSTPTLVVQSRNHPMQDTEAGRRLAAGISGARLIEVDEPLPLARERLPALIRAFLEVEEPQPGAVATSRASTANLTAQEVRTILFTDLASSTALTQRLGDAKAQELVRAHNDIVREALRSHGGTEIKHTGDGIMASFPTASGGLECAVAIQRAVAERGERDLQVHIGLNAGEPVAEEQDLFGTAVQLARRICDHAEAGEILVSNVVRELAAGKEFLFAERPAAGLKGFEEPVRVFAVRWQEAEE
jgi:class 3 adenylate cyclase/pimeloyl-ACP methyl ester carboxylesterase